MSADGYGAVGLPAHYRSEEGRAGLLHIPSEVLLETLKAELATNEAYVARALEAGAAGFAESAAHFDEGRIANTNGDRFSLVGVLYAVGLFLAGVSLVFKSRVRWLFATLSLVVLLGATVLLYAVPWAGDTATAAGTGATSAAGPLEADKG